MIYIVVWSGGYEAPSYAAHKTKKEAFKLAVAWQKDADEESDWIDVLAIDTKTMQVKRLEQTAWTPEGKAVEEQAVEGWFPPVDKDGKEV